METLVKIIHVMVCIFLMLTVLLQAGKGGGMGAAFGGGTSMGTVFGGSGAGNFLKKLTVAAAMIFMITSMTLAWMATPSTDPLKEYWAQQQAAQLERERAHKAAIDDSENEDDAEKDEGPEGSDVEGIDKPEEDVAPEGETTPEGEDAIDTPDTEAPATEGAGDTDVKPAPKPEAVKPPPAKKVNPAQPVQPAPETTPTTP
ncbi:MAG TPA: preprotein translocase subunit SecG [Kofleriaceae bacterium]|nr:preprotein translocase subunit SecG [Kofleriaceae bacterium]